MEEQNNVFLVIVDGDHIIKQPFRVVGIKTGANIRSNYVYVENGKDAPDIDKIELKDGQNLCIVIEKVKHTVIEKDLSHPTLMATCEYKTDKTPTELAKEYIKNTSEESYNKAVDFANSHKTLNDIEFESVFEGMLFYVENGKETVVYAIRDGSVRTERSFTLKE